MKRAGQGHQQSNDRQQRAHDNKVSRVTKSILRELAPVQRQGLATAITASGGNSRRRLGLLRRDDSVTAQAA